jgi:hypothetical protein
MSSSPLAAARAGCWLALVLALGACVEDSGSLSYATDIEPILLQTCARCHAGADPEGEIAFIDAGFDGLLALDSQQVDMAFVEPGDSLHSYLWHKMNASQNIAGGSGSAMPQGELLDAATVQLVADWIDAGARP